MEILLRLYSPYIKEKYIRNKIILFISFSFFVYCLSFLLSLFVHPIHGIMIIIHQEDDRLSEVEQIIVVIVVDL